MIKVEIEIRLYEYKTAEKKSDRVEKSFRICELIKMYCVNLICLFVRDVIRKEHFSMCDFALRISQHEYIDSRTVRSCYHLRFKNVCQLKMHDINVRCASTQSVCSCMPLSIRNEQRRAANHLQFRKIIQSLAQGHLEMLPQLYRSHSWSVVYVVCACVLHVSFTVKVCLCVNRFWMKCLFKFFTNSKA